MTKQKINKKHRSEKKLLKVVTSIIILAFIIYMLADLITKTPKISHGVNNKNSVPVYKFKKEGELSFQSKTGQYISSMDIEFAENEYERTQGLMYRTEMKEEDGMLFIFPQEANQSFWMKNTVISLDMFFINSKFEIVTIHEKTEPYSLKSYPSTAPAQYVLETDAGYASKFNIKVGDRVIFRKTN